jgi:hypothetical protein
MRNDNGTVVDYFRLPSSPPAPVVAAYTNYRRLCDEYADACLAYTAASNAIVVAHDADVRELAGAYADGAGATVVAGTREQAAQRDADDARLRREALGEAIDVAGDVLMDSIEAVQAEWLSELAETTSAAEKTFVAAIDDASTAAQTLADARGTADWLSRFEARKMRTGGAPPGTQRVMAWNGVAAELHAPVPGTSARMFKEMAPARELLASLKQAVKP